MFATRLKIIAATKEKKWYTQNFKEWLESEDPELKDWLRQDAKNLDACYCVCCEVQLKNANKSTLIAHIKTAKHKKLFAITKSTIKLISCFAESSHTFLTGISPCINM